MTPASSVSPKAQIERHAFSQQATASHPSEKLATSGTWKGKSRDYVRGIPNPFHYLWKYGPLAVGTGLLLMARGCSALINNHESCVKLIRHDPRCEPMRLERAWQIDDEPEDVRTLFLNSDKIYEVGLDGVKPNRVSSRTITPIFHLDLEQPQVVNLKDMTLVDGIFYNKTPYTIHGLYVKKSSVLYLDFARPVQGYTAVYLGGEFARHKIADSATLGNNRYDLALDSNEDHPEARAVDATERRWVERMQIYQQYWANSPGTLCEFGERLDECVESRGYPPSSPYSPNSRPSCGLNPISVRMHPVSGITSKLWIDPSLGTGMYAARPTVMATRGPAGFSTILRMSPKLMEGIAAGIRSELARSVAIDHVPNYYSEHLWSSFSSHLYNKSTGDSSPPFPDYPGDFYTPANLAVDTDRLDHVVYRFTLHSADTVSDLRMRLLSYQVVSARVMLTDRDAVLLAFDEAPREDVHVSFYSKESDQMASVTLPKITSVIEGKEAISRLANPNVLADMLTKVLDITIKTDDDAWLPEFNLPIPTPNRIVRFRHQADKPSVFLERSSNRVGYLRKNWVVDCEANGNRWSCSVIEADKPSFSFPALAGRVGCLGKDWEVDCGAYDNGWSCSSTVSESDDC